MYKVLVILVIALIGTTLPLSAQDTLRIDPPDAPSGPKIEDGLWEEIVSNAGRFGIRAPGYMIEKVDTIKTQLGEMAYHTYFLQSPVKTSDNLFYMVSYCDYPEGSVHADSTELLEEFFDVTVKESAFSISGDLVYSNPWEWNDYPGRIWRVDYLKGEAIIKTRAFLVDNRYYSMQTIMLKDKSLNPSSKAFFDSFYLLDQEASGN
ncbi:MAG: hypothetical protein R2824_23200 [Saprospiraceae bacterium]